MVGILTEIPHLNSKMSQFLWLIPHCTQLVAPSWTACKGNQTEVEMDIFVHRQPGGFITNELQDLEGS